MDKEKFSPQKRWQHKETIKLFEMINLSKEFSGFTMNGYYTMDDVDFLDAFDYFLTYNKCILDDHHYMMMVKWGETNYWPGMKTVLSEDDIKKYQDVLDNKSPWNTEHFLDDEERESAKKLIESSKYYHEYQKSYEARRLKASLYTRKQSIRNKVFRRDGKNCSWCGTTENLTLDHIKPVSKGGRDELKNTSGSL